MLAWDNVNIDVPLEIFALGLGRLLKIISSQNKKPSELLISEGFLASKLVAGARFELATFGL
jgi:hypothetical protein